MPHEYRDEIKYCAALYKEFSEVKDLIELLYKKKHAFFRDIVNKQESVSLDATEIKGRLAGGTPLFRDRVVEKRLLIDFARYICDALLEVHPELEEALHLFIEGLKSHLTQVVKISDLFVIIQEMEGSEKVKKDFVTFLLTFVFSGVIESVLKRDMEATDAKSWEKGICPVCGEHPHFGLLRGDGGKRVLHCWLCGWQWEYPRLKCPSCENLLPEELGYFTVEGQKVCRIYFCKKCNHYHKEFDIRELASDNPILAVHNLATLSYDLLAVREGFTPASGLQWVNGDGCTKSAN